MAVSIPILILIISLHLLAFALAIAAELHRSTAKVVVDESGDYNYCMYTSTSSTEYGLLAFGLLLISQIAVTGVTKCLCFNKTVLKGCWRALFFFVISWVSFMGAEACLLGGSIKNAYRTKYRTIYLGIEDTIPCETLHKGVFAAGAVLVLLSMVGSLVCYRVHSIVDTSDWDELQDEKLPLICHEVTEN